MDKINAILPKTKYSEPNEIKQIKKYILDKYGYSSKVQLNNENFIITVDNASLASTLRLNIEELKKFCQIKSKLIIRIGS